MADQFVTVDNDALFRCQLPPQARDLFQVIGWLEDGQHLIQSLASQQQSGQTQQQRAIVLPDGQLYIRRVQLKDANKSYRCQIRNLLNSKVSLSALSGRLFVTGKFLHSLHKDLYSSMISALDATPPTTTPTPNRICAIQWEANSNRSERERRGERDLIWRPSLNSSRVFGDISAVAKAQIFSLSPFARHRWMNSARFGRSLGLSLSSNLRPAEYVSIIWPLHFHSSISRFLVASSLENTSRRQAEGDERKLSHFSGDGPANQIKMQLASLRLDICSQRTSVAG